jgi:hypothetical protein
MIDARGRERGHHFLSERINAGEFTLRDDDILKLIDLAMYEFSLRSQKPLERLNGTSNLRLR